MGHQQIIRQTVKTAALEGLTSTVMTFINFNKTEDGVLTTLEEKRELLSLLGVDELLVLDFNQVEDMPAKDFLNEIILMKLSARAILAGNDYRFGSKAMGDADLLKLFGEEKGIEVSIFEDKLYGQSQRRLSSTWLREAAGEGDVELYAKLCGGAHDRPRDVAARSDNKVGLEVADYRLRRPARFEQTLRCVYVPSYILGAYPALKALYLYRVELVPRLRHELRFELFRVPRESELRVRVM